MARTPAPIVRKSGSRISGTEWVALTDLAAACGPGGDGDARVPSKVIQHADQAHGIRGHWNAVHRAMSELRWFDTYMKE